MQQMYIQQAKFLAKQMKKYRREGKLALAKQLEETISMLNKVGQSSHTL